MKHKLRLLVMFTLLVLVLLPVGTVWAACPPNPPIAFSGTVTVGGSPAVDGTAITLWVGATQIGSTTTSGGIYSINICPDAYVGETIVFKVSGEVGGQYVCPASAPAPITVNLVVVIVTEPDITVTPTTKNFGDVQVGTKSAAQTFDVGNDGDADLDVYTITLEGDDPDQFEITYDGVSGQTIAPMGSESLDVKFTPDSAGTKRAILRIPSNDPDTPTLDVNLRGRGTSAPPPPSDICEAIEEGVDWLVGEQNTNGSWGSCGDYWVGQTALVLLKLETHATDPDCGYGLPSPLDSRYPYRQNVQDGLDFLMDNKVETPQGTYFHSDCVSRHEPYETGCALMAIAASREPGTYGDVAQDTVDWLAWAQNDNGGWGYEANVSRSDNSITGWVVLGLQYAESPAQGFECDIPGFVRDELEDWVDYIQCTTPGDDFGGSGYTSPCDWVNSLKTGNLLSQFEFLGDDVNDPRVQNAVDYIVRQWDDTSDCYYGPGWREQSGDPAHYHAMFSIMKGLEGYGIERIDGIDWFDDIAEVLLEQQNPDGSWPTNCCWCDSHSIRSTAWALLTLQKAVAKPPVPAISCDFTAMPRRGMTPLTVQFSDLSTGPIDSWRWDFGDGKTSMQQNPRHIYYQPGRYDVTLLVNGDSTECEIIMENYIEVLPDLVEEEGPNLAAAYLLVSPEEGRPGQEFEISINVGNDGGTTGTRSIALYLNGVLEQSQTVSVGPGSSKLLVFRVTKWEPGVYQVLLEGNEGQFTVIEQEDQKFYPGPLGTPGIIVIVVVAVVLIGAIVFVFMRRE